MITDGRSFNDGTCADVNMVPDLHGIVVEIAAVGLVGWPRRQSKSLFTLILRTDETEQNLPHDAAFSYETVASQRDNDGMARPCSS